MAWSSRSERVAVGRVDARYSAGSGLSARIRHARQGLEKNRLYPLTAKGESLQLVVDSNADTAASLAVGVFSRKYCCERRSYALSVQDPTERDT